MAKLPNEPVSGHERKVTEQLQEHYHIIDTKLRVPVTLAAVVSEALSHDVLLVGEFHDDPVAHAFEHELLTSLLRYHTPGPPPVHSAAAPAPGLDHVSACFWPLLGRGLTNSQNLWTVLHEEPSLITHGASSEARARSDAARPPLPPGAREHRRVSDVDPAEPFNTLCHQQPSYLTACAGVNVSLTQGPASQSYSSAAAQSAAAAAVQPLLRTAFQSLSTFCGMSPSVTSHGSAGGREGTSRDITSAVSTDSNAVSVDSDGTTGDPAAALAARHAGHEARYLPPRQPSPLAAHKHAAALAAERSELASTGWMWSWHARGPAADAAPGDRAVAGRNGALSSPCTPPRGSSPAAPASQPAGLPRSIPRSPLGAGTPLTASSRVRSEPAMRALLPRQAHTPERLAERAVANGSSLAGALGVWSGITGYDSRAAEAGTGRCEERGTERTASTCAAPHDCAVAEGADVSPMQRRDVVLSLEMFERDVQPVLDEYAAGAIAERDLLKDGRAWPNYQDYRPLVESARAAGARIVAANAPRRYVSLVGRKGPEALAQLDGAAAFLPPLPVAATSPKLRDKVAREMDRAFATAQAAANVTMASPGGSDAGQGARGSAASPARHDADTSAASPCSAADASQRATAAAHCDAASLPSHAPAVNFLAAQSLWDAAMAHSIACALDGSPKLLMHVCGRFHMEASLGIQEHLQDYAPAARSLAVACVPCAPNEAAGNEGASATSAWPDVQPLADSDVFPGAGYTVGELCGLARFVVLTNAALPRSF